MVEEVYTDSQEEFTLKVEASEISSFRRRSLSRKAVRVYEGGRIGIAGSIGEDSEGDLLRRAKEKLKFSVEYRPEPSENMEKSLENGCHFKDEENLKEEFEDLLEELKERHPEFLYSGWASLKRSETILRNDRSLFLRHGISTYEFAFLIKRRDTANIMDGYLWTGGVDYDPRRVREFFDGILNALKTDLEWNEGRVRMPVMFIVSDASPVAIFSRDLHPLKFAEGGSLFSGRLGEKLFSDAFTLYSSRNFEDGVYTTFFDMEGTVLEDGRKPLVESGILVTPFTSKKYALEFGYDLTASASGDFDAVPDVGYPSLALKPTHAEVADVVDRGIFVLVGFGGDYTPEGTFSLPIQVPLLYEDGEFIGRLPPLRASSNVWDMFGRDFLGVSEEGLLANPATRVVVFDMEVGEEI